MKSNLDIIGEAHEGIQENLLVTSWWRSEEVRDHYALYEGSQWLEDGLARQAANNMPVRTINRIQPAIDAITGFEIQNRSELKYVPRMSQSQQEQGFSDLANDGVKFIQDTSGFHYKKSLAMRDMLLCGMGWVDTNISYLRNPMGEVHCERVFPYFMLWDVTARGQNLSNYALEGPNWIARAHIINREKLNQVLVGIDDVDFDADEDFGSAVDSRFLEYFSTVMVVKSLGVIYNYQWRDPEIIYRVENPFKGYEGDPYDLRTQNIVEVARVMQERYKCDPFTDAVIAVPKDEKAMLLKTFDYLGYERIETVQEKTWKYYRADIVGNKVIRKSENFSPTGYSTQCMTGKYDEIKQCYYGLVRSMKEPQRMLNQAVSDYEGFLRTIPKGGYIMEWGAVKDMEGFMDTIAKAAQVTVVDRGAITEGRIQPKVAPPIPQGLQDMIVYADQAIMDVIGITQAFMGESDSKLMTAQLNSQMVRQGLMVLAPYFDALTQFTMAEGQLFLDCLRVLMENSEGRLVKYVTDEGSTEFVPLLADNLANDYEISITEVPFTPDERDRTLENLLKFQQTVGPNVDLSPIILELLPLDSQQKEKIRKAMTPPPPPQPDPIQTALLETQAQLQSAQAEKSKADAQKSMMDALLKEKELGDYDKSKQMENIKMGADAEYAFVRSMKEWQNIEQGGDMGRGNLMKKGLEHVG